jgi:hypothetical protein
MPWTTQVSSAKGSVGSRFHLFDQLLTDLVDSIGGKGSGLLKELDGARVKGRQGQLTAFRGNAHHHPPGWAAA